MPLVAQTAEWVCTRCGTTNRKLVPEDVDQFEDRCVSCKTPHVVHQGPRPVRWEARSA